MKPHWTHQAACRGVPDPNIFYTENPRHSGPSREVTATAQQYCAHCPVIAACATYADQERCEGLWGGVWRNRGHAYPVILQGIAS
jgi:hypothetical protein